MTKKHYAERDIMAQDDAGNFYRTHVSAMTAEGLHSKSAIAAELGHRDMLIAQLTTERDALTAKLEATKTLVEQLTLLPQAKTATERREEEALWRNLVRLCQQPPQTQLTDIEAQTVAQCIHFLSSNSWPDEIAGQRHHAAQNGWWLCVTRLREYHKSLTARGKP